MNVFFCNTVTANLIRLNGRTPSGRLTEGIEHEDSNEDGVSA